MKAKEPLHEYASYGMVQHMKCMPFPPRAAGSTKVHAFVEEYDSSSSDDEVPEEREDNPEEVPHEAGEYPIVEHKTIPKEHREETS
jgi:hypothetical protein